MVIAEPTTSRGDQTVKHIKQLQETELQAFRELENKTGAVTLTSEEKSELITKINDLSATRETLYDSLRENHDFYSKNLTGCATHTRPTDGCTGGGGARTQPYQEAGGTYERGTSQSLASSGN